MVENKESALLDFVKSEVFNMKQKIVYLCEFCSPLNQEYFCTEKECEAHEATHFGLTPTEYRNWHILSTSAAEAGRRLGCSCDDETRKKFDEAVEKLVYFETNHKLLNIEKKPSQFYR